MTIPAPNVYYICWHLGPHFWMTINRRSNHYLAEPLLADMAFCYCGFPCFMVLSIWHSHPAKWLMVEVSVCMCDLAQWSYSMLFRRRHSRRHSSSILKATRAARGWLMLRALSANCVRLNFQIVGSWHRRSIEAACEAIQRISFVLARARAHPYGIMWFIRLFYCSARLVWMRNGQPTKWRICIE